MGYIRGLIHGMVLGTAVGLAIAPQEGKDTRAQMSRFADGMRRSAMQAQDTVQRMAPQVQGLAKSATDTVTQIRGKVQGNGQTEQTSALAPGTVPTMDAARH